MNGLVDAIALIASFVVVIGILSRSNHAGRPPEGLPPRSADERPDLT